MDVRAAVGTIAIAIVVVSIVTLGLRLLNWVWLRPKKLEKLLKEQGLVGNSYRVLFGDFKDLVTIKNSNPINPISHDIVPYVLPYFHHLINKFGKSSYMWFGPNPRLTIMDPELIKEILSKPNIYHKPLNEPFRDMIAGGLLVLEGEKWAKHRKIIIPAFRLEKLKNKLSGIYSSCSNMMNKWEMLISTSDSSEVDVQPYLHDLSGDMISRTAFGSNHEEGSKIFRLQKEQMEIAIQLLWLTYIPGWRYLPLKANKRFMEACNEIQALLRGIINKREKAIGMGETNTDDLLGILLESNSKEIKEHGIGMSMEDVMEECKLFYFAGSETTSTLLVWTMVLLSIHGNWQIRAREEVLQNFGIREPNFDDLNHLKVVTMILYEVLRLYPPVHMISRAISKETKLGNMSLPAGVEFTLPILQVHHDREIWGEDSTEFKPDRFSEGISNATKGKVSFLPFSGGPRACIGQNLAMIEAKMAISVILQRFSFELSPSYKHFPSPFITIPPKFGAQLFLHKI